MGEKPEKSIAHVRCWTGPRSFPFELCAERFHVPGLIEMALGGDLRYLGP